MMEMNGKKRLLENQCKLPLFSDIIHFTMILNQKKNDPSDDRKQIFYPNWDFDCWMYSVENKETQGT